MSSTAKIFTTGRSQAVRLPLEFRFDVSEVFIRHDPSTGDVVLSRKPNDWQSLLDAVALTAAEDLLMERRQPALAAILLKLLRNDSALLAWHQCHQSHHAGA